jgi:hypothetical protein
MDRESDTQETGPLTFAPIAAEPPTAEPGTGTGRRLVVGFVLCCVIAGVCWGVLPRFGVWVPVWLPLAGFGLIVFAAIVAGPERDGDHGDGPGAGCCGDGQRADEGRPICCSGPRPMRVFRE